MTIGGQRGFRWPAMSTVITFFSASMWKIYNNGAVRGSGVLFGREVTGIYITNRSLLSTYDHRTLKTRLPVRSALFKQRTGGLVVRWVTTSEYPLLYVFLFCWSFLGLQGAE